MRDRDTGKVTGSVTGRVTGGDAESSPSRTAGDAESRTVRRVERVVLVGFMAAGKTVVGEALARRLGWTPIDVDAALEEEAGAPIAQIFARAGEATFRRLEAAATRAALGRDRVVVATGGGWPSGAASGWPEIPAGTLSVWLRVSAREAVRRARAGGLATRPKLARGDPVAGAEALLSERIAAYRQAAVHVDTEGRTPAELALWIAGLVEGASAPLGEAAGGTNDG